MQPGVPQSPLGAEQLPLSGSPRVEQMPTLPAPEVGPQGGIETGVERREQAAELQAAKSDASQAATAATAVPVVPVDPAAVPAAPTSTTSSPLTAANDDVIEKEWVDKAKQIVDKTKGDPYQRGEQVNALQKDYLKKRFGKDIDVAA